MRNKSLTCCVAFCLLLISVSTSIISNAQTPNRDQLRSGESLRPDQHLKSPNGRYSFFYQFDGNLVLYRNYPNRSGKAIWASNTNGQPGQICTMQADGNLVAYATNGRPIWASNTAGNPGSRLVIQDDGNVVIYRADDTAAWATNTVQQNQVLSDELIAPDQVVTSLDGRYSLMFQFDGNLVLYKNYTSRPRKAIWASNTNGQAGQTCIMQGDGNLVIYASSGNAIWATGTNGNPGSKLVVQDDGNVVIYRDDNTAVWATNTVQNQLQKDESLGPNQYLNSLNGRYTFLYQGDGNLVLYKNYQNRPPRPLWASNTNGQAGQTCIMQADGNLVIYAPNGSALWATNTNGNPGSRLVVQDDGNVVIYRANNSSAWATNTPQQNQLLSDESLKPDQSLTSLNGRYTFIYQGDGNLVLYENYPTRPRKPVWASNTIGRPRDLCMMQADGNLVIYGPARQSVWASGTNGNPGSRLVVEDDGNIVIKRGDNSIAWATKTSNPQFVQIYVDEIKSIQTTSDIGDAVDEIYLVVEGLSRKGVISHPRIPNSASQDYFALDDGQRINVGTFMGRPLWEGYLIGDRDEVYVAVVVMEQDNAQLSSILHYSAAGAAALAGIFVPDLLPIALSELETATRNLIESLISSSDEYIGAFTLHVIKQGAVLTPNWGAKQDTQLIQQQGGFSAIINATGGGRYEIKARVNRVQ